MEEERRLLKRGPGSLKWPNVLMIGCFDRWGRYIKISKGLRKNYAENNFV
jgi:hypothetical protein